MCFESGYPVGYKQYAPKNSIFSNDAFETPNASEINYRCLKL